MGERLKHDDDGLGPTLHAELTGPKHLVKEAQRVLAKAGFIEDAVIYEGYTSDRDVGDEAEDGDQGGAPVVTSPAIQANWDEFEGIVESVVTKAIRRGEKKANYYDWLGEQVMDFYLELFNAMHGTNIAR